VADSGFDAKGLPADFKTLIGILNSMVELNFLYLLS
jgi:hypothetical protein